MKKSNSVTAEIVRIGNSHGVRIPKSIREQAGLTGTVTLTVTGGALVIRAKRKPREGWEKQYRQALKESPEQELLLPDDVGTVYDKDWTW
ncbi:MAG: AbrB/MazE/SpoVT family DNA-binding domain-containing protein [Alphaproteobacteria bacterium]|nr:AbrB/MazE/SpoVT family DNA-binding domain-containing protein [Alphaproteobacteria bacterium]